MLLKLFLYTAIIHWLGIVSVFVGPIGGTGFTGSPGATGPPGPLGPQGVRGPLGFPGDRGKKYNIIYYYMPYEEILHFHYYLLIVHIFIFTVNFKLKHQCYYFTNS